MVDLKSEKVTTYDAEEWLDPDTFVVNGHIYRVNLDLSIEEIITPNAI